MTKKILVVGGGAAGFFGAINASIFHPEAEITLLEKSNTLLGKVKVSGGGRCNVTHACFAPDELVKYYPRGKEFLLEVFKKFNPTNTLQWFKERGVNIQAEADGRMFPVSNSSQTIIDCFMSEAKNRHINIITNQSLLSLARENEFWKVETQDQKYLAHSVLITPGSSSLLWDLFKALGHHIIEPVPSLFTFNTKDPRLEDLPGLSMEKVETKITTGNHETTGPVLITHWGLSGPGILKLSAFAARDLSEINYHFPLQINWLGASYKEVLTELKRLRDADAKKLIGSQSYFNMPKRLWKSLTDFLNISDLKWASAGNTHLEKLATELCTATYQIEGKSTFKEEFVTAGGIDLDEVNPETMESKLLPGIFFAGEFLNIDAVTGGFNFQAAWSCSWLAAKSM